MLKDSFYTLLSFDSATFGQVTASLKLNPGHGIFQGHFPGMPVVPGVCMLQIVKECLEHAEGRSLRLHQANNLKFLSVLVPVRHGTVQAVINFDHSEDGLAVSDAVIRSEETSFLKAQKLRYS